MGDVKLRIGLIDVDSHNFPNLALMKISAWHKAQGDTVEWWYPMADEYDIVYMSKVFDDPMSYYGASSAVKCELMTRMTKSPKPAWMPSVSVSSHNKLAGINIK